MRRTTLINLAIVTVAVIAVSFAWAGGDEWKTKPYQQWDQKDIQQVLSSSPWVRIQSMAATWRGGSNVAGMGPSGGYGQGEGSSGEAGEGGGAGARGSMGTGDRRTGGESPMDNDAGVQGPRVVSFTVRWNSAQTIREALARNALLNNKISEADSAKYVAQMPAQFEIFVGGQDMTPFAGVTEDELKAKTYLEVKQSKQKIGPASVIMQHTPDNKRLAFLVFSFPRQVSGGQAFITPKDKNVEFSCKLKNFDLHANFDLHKMVNEKGQDL